MSKQTVEIVVTKEILSKINNIVSDLKGKCESEIEEFISDYMNNNSTVGFLWWKKPVTRKHAKKALHENNGPIFHSEWFWIHSKYQDKIEPFKKILDTFSDCPLPQTISVSFSTFKTLFKNK